MLNPTMMSMVVCVHQQKLLEDARKSRMPEVLRNGSPRFRERLLMCAGDVLISAGTKLQSQCPSPEACQ